MPPVLSDIVGALTGAVTHEGAAAFDLSADDPLTHLVFSRGATLFTDTYYKTQAEEVASYARALLAAERAERGFGWKFAAYMRDPRRGKGNRIQGTIASAILSAADPDGPFTAEYVAKCLSNRADDVVRFVAHFDNLGLGDVPAQAREGMARALAGMDEYQLLKYARRQFPLARRRANGKPASLRLVDAMGLARQHLPPRTLALYHYLHAPTRQKEELAAGLELARARRDYFKRGDVVRFAAGRVSTEQALSHGGATAETWRRLLAVPGLLPDIAFKQYVRSMHKAGLSVEELTEQARQRRFAGLWPHQVYAGYRAIMSGVDRPSKWTHVVGFHQDARPELAPVFEAILERVAANVLPDSPSLGIADVSGSMFGPKLGGEHSSVNVGDAALVLASLMARHLGYAATFSNTIFLEDQQDGETTMAFAERLRQGQGMGSTQVAGSVVSLIGRLLDEPQRLRPRTLYFFSDMQFHPPEEQTMANVRIPAAIRKLFKGGMPPLLAALTAYRQLLGPVDVVLWNLAAYDNAPLPSGMAGVLMLAGFDANSFRHVTTWQAAGSPATAERETTSGPRDPEAEIAYIRQF